MLGNRGKTWALRWWGPGRSPGRKRFQCNLITTDRLWWQQILHLCLEKWGYGTPSPKSGGTGTPRTLYAYGCRALSVAGLELSACWTNCVWLGHWQRHSYCRSPLYKVTTYLPTYILWTCHHIKCIYLTYTPTYFIHFIYKMTNIGWFTYTFFLFSIKLVFYFSKKTYAVGTPSGLCRTAESAGINVFVNVSKTAL